MSYPKTYTYEGKEYMESGEVRLPIKGEIYLSSSGQCGPARAAFNFANERCKILIPKTEERVEEEYNIPVLVKVVEHRNHPAVKAVMGKVVLCKKTTQGDHVGPQGVVGSAGVEFTHLDHECIPYPTREQVEAEQAKLKPKADPLPTPVRDALDAADLGCRREGVAKLIEAIYQNPPVAK